MSQVRGIKLRVTVGCRWNNQLWKNSKLVGERENLIWSFFGKKRTMLFSGKKLELISVRWGWQRIWLSVKTLNIIISNMMKNVSPCSFVNVTLLFAFHTTKMKAKTRCFLLNEMIWNTPEQARTHLLNKWTINWFSPVSPFFFLSWPLSCGLYFQFVTKLTTILDQILLKN